MDFLQLLIKSEASLEETQTKHSAGVEDDSGCPAAALKHEHISGSGCLFVQVAIQLTIVK